MLLKDIRMGKNFILHPQNSGYIKTLGQSYSAMLGRAEIKN